MPLLTQLLRLLLLFFVLGREGLLVEQADAAYAQGPTIASPP